MTKIELVIILLVISSNAILLLYISNKIQINIKTILLQIKTELLLQLQNNIQNIHQESINNFSQLQQVLTTQIANIVTVQNNQIDSFILQLENMRQTIYQQAQHDRAEQGISLKNFSDTLNQTLLNLTQSNSYSMTEIRATLEAKIKDLQCDNANRLEEMRQTVDEKLYSTLDKRLGESFQLVSNRLEKVHQGLGEMQKLAIGVGDLKRVLTNVKVRGTWGEVQLENLLTEILTIDQYAKNVEIIPNSGERVEFAIKLPGSQDNVPLTWLPIDAKFPKEQYERLIDATEHADVDAIALAGRELERIVRNEAKNIAKKYLAPPLTTDFAILFLSTEGLYSEIIRRPGLIDELQRSARICIAGPSTILALLNSLQMGFRTLTLEKRSSEVWQVLGAVKTEFAKFSKILSITKNSLERAAKNIEHAETRTRQMTRKLKLVESIPSENAQQLLEITNTVNIDNIDE